MTSNAHTLGTLFARRSRTATRYLAAIVGAITALSICALFGLIGFLSDAGDRGAARDIGPFVADGCIQGQYRYISYDLNQYERLLLASTCDNPPAPAGLTAFPQPGEVFISPALAELRSADNGIAAQLPNVTGIISDDGLVHQDELRVVAGIDPALGESSQGRASFDAFGSNNDYLTNALRFGRGTLYIIGSFFALLPAFYLVTVATKVNARMRERQLGLLAVIGLDPTALRRTQVWEATLTVGAGAIIGAALSAPLLSVATPTFLGWRAFPGDLATSWYIPLVAFAATVFTAAAAAWLAARRTHRVATNTSPTTTRPTMRVAILSFGIIAGAISGWWNTDAAWPLVLSGRTATFIGLVAVTPIAVSLVGQRLADETGTTTSLVGARLRKPAGSLIRSLAALTSGLFLLSAGASSVGALGNDPATLQAEIDAGGDPVIEVFRPNDSALDLLADYDILAGPINNTGLPELVTGTLTGSCDALSQTIGQQLDCAQSPFYVRIFPEQPVPEGLDATPINLTARRSEALTGQLITINADATDLDAGASRYIVTVPADRATDLYNQLIGSDIAANVRTGGQAGLVGASELDNILDVFRWGAGFAVAASFIAALFSLVSTLHDRTAANSYLQILGLTPRQTGTAAFTEVLIAAATTTALALLASWVWALSFSINSDNNAIGFVSLTTPFAVALATLSLSAAAIIWSTLRNTTSIVPDRDGLVSAHDVYAAAPTL